MLGERVDPLTIPPPAMHLPPETWQCSIYALLLLLLLTAGAAFGHANRAARLALLVY